MGLSDQGRRCEAHQLWWAAGAVAVFFTVCFPLTNTDLWWHLATGREIVARGGLPEHDPFAAGTQGVRWINLHWLFQLGAFRLYQAGGLKLLVLIKAGLVALAALLLLVAAWPARLARAAAPAEAARPVEARGAAAPQLRSLWAATSTLLVTVAVFLTQQLVLARPIVVTLAALAIFLLVLERYRCQPRPRLLLWLLPVQLFWANAQGGLQLLGPALVLSYLAGGSGEQLLARAGVLAGKPLPGRALAALALALVALLCCGLVTPFGPAGLELPWRLLGRIDPLGAELFRLNVSENVPPWLLERQPHVPLAVSSFKWLALAAFASFLPCLRRFPPGSLARLLLLAGLLLLALWANRNILLFAWLAGPLLVLNLGSSGLLQFLARAQRGRRVIQALSAAGLGLLVLLRCQAAADEPPLAQPAPFRAPLAAAAKLRQLGLDQGVIFSSVRYGSYLIWALEGRAKPTMDGRLVLRSAAQLAEHLDLADRPELFAAYARQQQIGVAVLPAAFPGRYLPLVRQLTHDPAWQLLQTDGTQTLFAQRRLLPPGTAAVALTERRQLERITASWAQAASPAIAEQGVLNLGQLLLAVGQPAQAAWLLRGAASWQARRLRAGALLEQGQLAPARRAAEVLLAEQPGEPDSLVLLATVSLREGRPGAAFELLEQALAREPYHPGARQLLSQLSRQREE